MSLMAKCQHIKALNMPIKLVIKMGVFVSRSEAESNLGCFDGLGTYSHHTNDNYYSLL